MEDHSIEQQAATIADLMPALMRQMFRADDALATGLPLAQLRVCSLLVEGPRPMSTLSKELGVSLSAMTQLADRLERTRLVRRIAEADDRRVRCLQLTPRGERLLRLRGEARVQSVAAVLEHLPPEARQKVLAGLEALMDACLAAHRRHAEEEVAGQPSV